MAKLYHFGYTCNSCKANVETRFHCTVCDDFDLCIKCHSTIGHVHKMQRLGFELGDDSAGGDRKQTNLQETRSLAIQRCIASLKHACQCRDAYCRRLPSCPKMKRIVSHAKTCKLKGNGSCAICKQLISLTCYHAKNCQGTKCPVPFCLNIKHKFKQQRLAQGQILNLTATMQNLNMTAKPPGQSIELRPQSQIIGANYMPNTAGSAPGAVRIPQDMLNPGTSASSAMQQRSNALAVLQQLLASFKSSPSLSLKQKVVHLLKSNPQLMAAFIKQMSAEASSTTTVATRSNEQANNDRAATGLATATFMGYMTAKQPGQPMELRPQSQIIGANNMPYTAGSAPGAVRILQDMSNPGTSASSAMQQRSNALLVLQQLLTSFKSSQSLSLKQQVLHLLKSNPQLMAAFIKQRSPKASSTTTVGTRSNEQASNDRAAASTATGLATTTASYATDAAKVVPPTQCPLLMEASYGHQ